MSLLINDSSIGIQIEDANVRIGFYTVNRNGYFENGQPKFSVNLYLEYSKDGQIYHRKDVTIEKLSIEQLAFTDFYQALKTLDEFTEAKDDIPAYPEYPTEATETTETEDNADI